MKISELQENSISDELVDLILFEALPYYGGQAVDAAIVLGSSKAHLYRLPPVVEAYKAGTVRKIICSGHTRPIRGQDVNEGALLGAKALEMGVCADDLLVEDKAENTWENLILSRALMLREGLFADIRAIAIATSSYHMRRSLCLAENVFAHDKVTIVSIPGEDSSTQRGTWYTNEKGRERCTGEVRKILWAVRQGIIQDWDLP